MALNKALFSSAKEDWETPQDFFNKLDAEFHFNLDPCADNTNAKCERYFTKEENGLLRDWGGGVVCFVTRRMAGRQPASGSKNVRKKLKSRERLLLRLFRRALIRNFFTITYTTKPKFASLKGD